MISAFVAPRFTVCLTFLNKNHEWTRCFIATPVSKCIHHTPSASCKPISRMMGLVDKSDVSRMIRDRWLIPVYGYCGSPKLYFLNDVQWARYNFRRNGVHCKPEQWYKFGVCVQTLIRSDYLFSFSWEIWPDYFQWSLEKCFVEVLLILYHTEYHVYDIVKTDTLANTFGR